MNYRHSYHAGNFADVFKHILLARIVEYMKRKEKPFRVFDIHSGRGFYDLACEEAQKTQEHVLGVGKVQQASRREDVARLIAPWEAAVKTAGDGNYPGSPRLIHSLLRKVDRLSLYELHLDDYLVLAAGFANDYQTRVYNTDGWLVPVSYIPPKEGRGVILADAPFEDGKDFDRMIDLLQKTRKRWPGATVALWYPVKRRDHTDEWLDTLRGLKFADMLAAEIHVREPRLPDTLNGCGMAILNPPYTLRDEIDTILPWLAETLHQGKGWGYRIQDLSAR